MCTKAPNLVISIEMLLRLGVRLESETETKSASASGVNSGKRETVGFHRVAKKFELNRLVAKDGDAEKA